MLTNEFIEGLEAKLQLKKGVLKEAIQSDEEKAVELPELVIYDKDSFGTFKSNLINDSRKGIVEVEYKKAAKELGFELPESKRNAAGFSEGLKDLFQKEMKIKPDEKIKEIEKEAKRKIDEALSKYEAVKSEKEVLQSDIFKSQVKFNAISSLKSDTIIPKEDVFALFTMRKAVPIKDEESGIIAAKDVVTGKVIKNEKLEPIPFTDIFKEFTDENFAKKGGAGTGGAGTGGAGKKGKDGILRFSTYEEWESHYGDDMMSEEAQKSLAASEKSGNFKLK
jgi:hypothetical protein